MKLNISQLYLPQPAHKIYAFDRGWRIMKYVSKNLFARTDVAARWWFSRAAKMRSDSSGRNWFVKYWLYVTAAGFSLAGAGQYISAMILVALFVAIHATLLSIWAAIVMVILAFYVIATFAFARINRIFFRCPDCHSEMPIPTFICYGCGTEHTRLWPSIYGIRYHRCKTCRIKLSTIELFGRKRLQRICPSCRHPMHPVIGTGPNLHIPIVGGASCGKTNFIVMATREFKQVYEQQYGYTVTLPDERHRLQFERNLQSLATGYELVKTTEIVPQAYNLRIKARKRILAKLAYVYDAAGEAFNTSDNTGRQVYYKYIHGIIFVIDPFAISGYRRLNSAAIERLNHLIRPSLLDVMQAYERMIQMFEASVGLRKGGRYPHPIAVVVTKVDALNLEYEIGAPAAQFSTAHNPNLSEGDAIQNLVRNFLCNYGLDHFVRDIESQFSNVRYFSCSALGRLPIPEDRTPFAPVRTADPLIWMLSQINAVKSPRGQHSNKKSRSQVGEQQNQDSIKMVQFK